MRDDRVDPGVLRGEQQGQAAAVGAADHADPGVAGGVGADVGAGGQPVEQPLGVAHLVVGAVQVDLTAAAAEAPRGPGQHRVAAVRPASSASARTESLVPPKPWASSTAGTFRSADAARGR